MRDLPPLLRPRIVDRRYAVILAYGLLVALLTPGLARLEVDNSAHRFFVRDAEARERYRLFESRFGRDRGVRLVLEGEAVWTPDGLDFLRHAEEEATALRGVIGVMGPWRLHHGRYESWPPADADAFRARLAAEDGLARRAGLVSADGNTVTALAGLYRLSGGERSATLDELRRILERAPEGISGRLVGLPVLSAVLDDAFYETATRLFPLVALLAAALLGAIFRRTAAVILPLVLVGTVEVALFGALGYLGVRLDFVSMILPPLLFVISLATAVHLLSAFQCQLQGGRSPVDAATAALRRKMTPVLATGLTTAAGFGSLATSAVPPVRDLGTWAALGIAFSTLAALTLYPALLATFGGSLKAGSRRGETLGRAAAGWAVRHRRALAAVLTILILALLPGIAALRTDHRLLHYLRPTHPLRVTTEALAERGIGAVAAELVLNRHGDAPPFDDERNFERWRQLSARILGEEMVLGTVGPGEIHAAVPPGQDIAEAPELERLLGFYLTRDRQHARLTVILPMLGLERLEPFLADLATHAREVFPESEAEITGAFPLTLTAQRRLLSTMAESLGLTFLVVSLAFAAFLRHPSLVWRAVLPNALPIVLVLGALGRGGWPIDSTTVMVASIVLGLAVDDTFHTLSAFLRATSAGSDPAEASVDALGETAGAHLTTSALLMLGFAVCGLASLVPIARFGLVSAAAIGIVLLADLLVVPALLAGTTRAAINAAARRDRQGRGERSTR